MKHLRQALVLSAVAVTIALLVWFAGSGVHEPGPMFGAARSGHWPKVRADHLAANPACECCGSKDSPQVHHVKSFRDFPELECDPGNLITLCGPEGHGCHFAIGHLWNYSRNNPYVREDAKRLRKRLEDAKRETMTGVVAP